MGLAVCRQAEAVVPVLVGPLQVLVALLPAILAALGAVVLSLFKPAMLRFVLRTLWHQKAFLLVMAAVAACAIAVSKGVARGKRTGAARSVGVSGSWSMFRGGPERRGTGGNDAGDPTEGGVVWRFASDARTFYASPALHGNFLFVTSAEKGVFNDEGAVYCLDADTGELLWRAAPRDYRATFSSPAVSNDDLVCGEGLHYTDDARLICLASRTGQLRWEFRTRSHVESSPCIYDGRVYFGAGDDGYYCLRLTPGPDGKPVVVWHAEPRRYPDAESSPVVWQNRVYVGLGMGGTAICCLDADTGEELWRVRTPYPVFGPPTIAGERLFVGMGNGNFVESAEVARANELQRMRASGASEAELTEASRRLAPAGEVWALDPVRGDVLWKFQLERTVLGAVAADAGRLYFGACDGRVYCLTADGKEVARWDAQAPIKASPALGKEHVYVVTETGKLYGLRRADLRPVWECPLGGEAPSLSSPAVGRGHVYVGTSQGGVVCAGVPARSHDLPLWAGPLGGPGRPGSIDHSSVPRRGTVRWQLPQGPEAAAPGEQSLPAVAPVACIDDRVYVPVFDGPRKGLVCLVRDVSGQQAPSVRWVFATQLGIARSPAATRRAVFVVDGLTSDAGRHVYCIEAESGALRWRRPVEPGASGEFTLSADYIVVQDRPGVLSCYDHSGKERWRELVGPLSGPPACSDAIVFAATREPTELRALDLPTGRTLLQLALSAAPQTGPVVSKHMVYLGRAESVLAFDLMRGAEAWHSETKGAVTPLVLLDSLLAYVSSDSELVVLDAADGHVVARESSALASVPPVGSAAAVLYATRHGLMRYDIAEARATPWLDGSLPGRVASPVVFANSAAYFATDNGCLVCVGGVGP